MVFSQVGIGTTNPVTTLEVNGGISLRETTALTLVNGVNNNVSLGATPYSFYRIIGPTAAFSLTGIVPVTSADGQIVTLENTTAQNFTITHNATSTAANRIFCSGATNTLISGQYSTVTLSYNRTQSRWIVIGVVDSPYGKNIQSVIGASDITIDTAIFTDMTNMILTFTPKHSTVYLNFGAAGYVNLAGATPNGEYLDFRIVNVTSGNTVIAGTSSLATDYDFDDIFGESVGVSWNAHFSMFPITVTAGTSTTIKIQWRRDGNVTAPIINNANSERDYCHRNLTIFD